jgi:hypothetical protein
MVLPAAPNLPDTLTYTTANATWFTNNLPLGFYNLSFFLQELVTFLHSVHTEFSRVLDNYVARDVLNAAITFATRDAYDRITTLEATGPPSQPGGPAYLAPLLARLDALEAQTPPTQASPPVDLAPLLARLTALEAQTPSPPVAVFDATLPAGLPIVLRVLLGSTRADYTVVLGANDVGPFRAGQSIEINTSRSGTTVMHLNRTGTITKAVSSIDAAPPARPVGVLAYAALHLGYNFKACSIDEGVVSLRS